MTVHYESLAAKGSPLDISRDLAYIDLHDLFRVGKVGNFDQKQYGV
jgi:hypothetical protein